MQNVKPVVLIVDDNKSYISRLIDLIEENGISNIIVTANEYNEAIRVIAKERPGIILLDVNMPGKSGIEVLRFIKEERWNCKVIMVTNHSNESYRKLCLAAGADFFLDKSRDFRQIPVLIERMSV